MGPCRFAPGHTTINRKRGALIMCRKNRWMVLILVGLTLTGCTASIVQNSQSNPLTGAASFGADFLRQVLAAILT